MRPRYRIYKRGKTFYKRNTVTGERTSLKTTSRAKAQKLVDAENTAAENPSMAIHMAQAYLSSSDPNAIKRSWQYVIDEYQKIGADSTRERKERVFQMKEFDLLRRKKLLETNADDFLAVLTTEKVSVNTYLIQLQNFALDMGWIAKPVVPRRRFPKTESKRKARAITLEEHQRVLAAENLAERRGYYHLLWLVGASQTDAALLENQNFDLKNRVLIYERKKTGQMCRLQVSDELEVLVRSLPRKGLLFPGVQNGGHNYRASEFRRRCRLLNIKGISLHSYRYSWAERAFEAGIPERFAMAALGHGSKAVHRAYAKSAQTVCPSIPSGL